jgi:hypothetical protein
MGIAMNKRAILTELRELRRRCDSLIEHVETEPRSEAAGGNVDQSKSELGPKRHCAAVRRRIARNEPGAFIVARRHYLTPQAYEEECQTWFRPAKAEKIRPAPPENDNDEVAAAMARLDKRLGKS